MVLQHFHEIPHFYTVLRVCREWRDRLLAILRCLVCSTFHSASQWGRALDVFDFKHLITDTNLADILVRVPNLRNLRFVWQRTGRKLLKTGSLAVVDSRERRLQHLCIRAVPSSSLACLEQVVLQTSRILHCWAHYQGPFLFFETVPHRTLDCARFPYLVVPNLEMPKCHQP